MSEPEKPKEPTPPATEEIAAVAGAPETTSAAPAQPTGRSGLDFVMDVPLRVTVEIGTAQMLVGDVLQLGRGSVIELDRMAGEPADVLVNGRTVARGEITLVDDRLAVRILDVDEKPS